MSFPYALPLVFGGSGTSTSPYAVALRHLLPQGRAWQDPPPVLLALLAGIADELERVKTSGIAAQNEMDPATTTDLIAEWEGMLGIPGTRFPTVPSTIEARRAQIIAALNVSGGLSLTALTALVAATGWTLVGLDRHSTPREYTAAGTSHDRLSRGFRASDRVLHRAYGPVYACTLTATVWPTGAATQFTLTQLRTLLTEILHAHFQIEVEVPSVRLTVTGATARPDAYHLTEWGDWLLANDGTQRSAIACAQINTSTADFYVYARTGGAYASMATVAPGTTLIGRADSTGTTGRSYGTISAVSTPPAYTP